MEVLPITTNKFVAVPLKITMLIYLAKIKKMNFSYSTYSNMLLKKLSRFNTNKAAGMT